MATEKSAVLSPCGRYRYELRRIWGTEGLVCFICLNPSKADADKDDRTVEKCTRLVKSWGYGGFVIVNLYALRSTKPNHLLTDPAPEGIENMIYVRRAVEESAIVVGAWSTHKAALYKDAAIKRYLAEKCGVWHYLKLNKNRTPAHPLYLPENVKPLKYHETKTDS